ncbi:CsbD family protein [uncultured Vagococcus sp.]|uniref:CsbD family protein n=1 Tax=uncultured Vagococcus sp. TaxID=189676 RepID=UPI0028D275B3|nr:CsbD family protein [uncultured Vagococcus sp.]
MVNKDELKGKANEALGKATGDESQELKGKAQGLFGKAKEKVEEGVDDIAEKANELIDKVKHKDHEDK